MQQLTISIITVCLNAAQTIERCIKSVAHQSYPYIEYIVIDGKSSDTTLNIIKNYPHVINTVISEHDAGLYFAMNKGLAIAKGDLIYFLNADDYLNDIDTIQSIATIAIKNPHCLLIQGRTVLDKDCLFKSNYPPYNDPFTTYNQAFTCIPPHQGLFIRRMAFDTIGQYNVNYKVYADYDWFLRAWRKKVNIIYTHLTVCQCHPFGLSYQQRWLRLPEKIWIVALNGNFIIFCYYLIFATRRTWRKLLKSLFNTIHQ